MYFLDALGGCRPRRDVPIVLATFVGIAPQDAAALPYPSLNLGYISSDRKLVLGYSMADLFVIPSPADNFPNTILEAIACGAPIVGFNMGNISDIMQHKQNCFLAEPRSVGSLIEGIDWALFDGPHLDLHQSCRRSMVHDYALALQAGGDTRVYQDLAGMAAKPVVAPSGAKSRRVSAIVSTYNSERFIRGCLDDLVRQTLFGKGELEIVVVDSGSAQNEGATVRDFQNRHGFERIRYIRTENRETVYGAWNRGVGIARGKYITNANTDDRHRRDSLEIMARALDANPDAGLVYADTLVTFGENETFENNTASYIVTRPDYSLRQALIFCFYGPQPMWRRSAHERVGMFDSRMVVAGDYDFFLRTSWHMGAIHVRDILGLYLANPESVERSNADVVGREVFDILRSHRSRIPLEDIYPSLRSAATPHDKVARLACLIDHGNCCLRSDWPMPVAAIMFYTQAIQMAGPIPGIMSNLAAAMYLDGRIDSSMQLLRKVKESVPLAKHNLELIETKAGRPAGDGNRVLLQLYDIDHPAVTTAMRGLGLVPRNSEFARIDSYKTYWSARETISQIPGKSC